MTGLLTGAHPGRVRIGAYAFAIDNGSILLAQVSSHDAVLPHGHWTLPGGGLEWGEHPEAALHRELYEETGLTATIEGVLGVDSAVMHEELQSLWIVYEVTCTGMPQVIEVEGTVQDARWIPLDEVWDHPIVSLVVYALDKAGIATRPS